MLQSVITVGSLRMLEGRGCLVRVRGCLLGVFVFCLLRHTCRSVGLGFRFLVGVCMVLVTKRCPLGGGRWRQILLRLASMPLNGLFFSGSVVAVGFSFDAETLFVDAGKRCSCCRFHTFMLYYRIH